MRKIKIVRIIDRLNIGGPAIHCVLLTEAMNDDRFSTTLIAGRVSEGEGDMSYLARQRGLEVEMVPELGRRLSLGADWAALCKILKIIRRERPDIVHTHKSKAGALGRVAAILSRVPVILHTFHGHVFQGYFKPWKTFIFLWIERALACFTHRIIVISEQQRKDIVRRYRVASEKKVVMVPLGFDFTPLDRVEECRGKLRRKFGFETEAIWVGIVGRLTGIKNHRMFLQAARQIIRTGHPVRFAIIGDGEERAGLDLLARSLGIESQVFFAGWIEEPAEIYADLDIVALTSLNEGTPVTLIEAMYCKKPVVSTRVGGVPDIVQDEETGFLVPSGDIDSFAEAVLRLSDDPVMRKKFGDRGHEMVCRRFDRKRLVQEIGELYGGLCMGRDKPSPRQSFTV